MKVELTNRSLPTHKYSDLKSGDLFTWKHNMIAHEENDEELLVMMHISSDTYVILNSRYDISDRLKIIGWLANEPVHKLTGTLKVELV